MSDVFEEKPEEMEEEELSTFVLTDEEGNEFTFELVDFVDYQKKIYAVLAPVEEENEDVPEEELGVVVMETEMKEGELTFNFVEDEALCRQILAAFAEQAEQYEVEED